MIGRILTGGDDYEILATVPPKALAPLEAAARAAGVAVTVVGKVTPGHAVVLRGADGRALDLGSGRFEHF
ncbi:Thiamine-monophosphate kinase [bacterium YEK0313]|nr:Thiamine-monophosphate kinase [bacterium YEK0313]